MKFVQKKRVYLDHASATPLRKEAAVAYAKVAALRGNPGSIHAEGRDAARSLLVSRESIAKELGCKAREILFTSGLTEANNLALLGYAARFERARPEGLAHTHWIVSSIEHQSVLACFSEIERRGGVVSHVDPDEKGIVRPEVIGRVLRAETVLVSIGWANSEIGTIQALRDIASGIRAHERKHGTVVLLHTDAGQAPLYIAPVVHTLDTDLFALGSGKLYGPRGVGALYAGRRVELAPLVIGGGQERGIRAGTESPALAAGFATALQIAGKERRAEGERIGALRDALARQLLRRIPGIVINGDLKRALSHMLNVSIPRIHGEYVVLALDQAGIACSTKSACSEGRVNESHVIAAIAKDPTEGWRARNTLRLSLGLETTAHDVETFVDTLAHILKNMPVFEV